MKQKALVLLLAFAGHSAGSLSKNFKLKDQMAKKAPAFTEAEILEQAPPQFHNQLQPFTSTAYYDYFDAFMLGLKLDTFFQGSGPCIGDIIYSLDDAAFFYNNMSNTQWRHPNQWIGPVFNLSHAVAGNVSESLPDCYTMGYNAYTAFMAYYASFSSLSNFFESFLFNMMGNSLKYKSIFA
jgi:hypothetical protein